MFVLDSDQGQGLFILFIARDKTSKASYVYTILVSAVFTNVSLVAEIKSFDSDPRYRSPLTLDSVSGSVVRNGISV